MHKRKSIDASLDNVADWKERRVVFEEISEFWLNNKVFSDIQRFNARQHNLLECFDSLFLLVFRYMLNDPFIHEILNVLFRFLKIKDGERMNGVRIDEFIKNWNVQDKG